MAEACRVFAGCSLGVESRQSGDHGRGNVE